MGNDKIVSSQIVERKRKVENIGPIIAKVSRSLITISEDALRQSVVHLGTGGQDNDDFNVSSNTVEAAELGENSAVGGHDVGISFGCSTVVDTHDLGEHSAAISDGIDKTSGASNIEEVIDLDEESAVVPDAVVNDQSSETSESSEESSDSSSETDEVDDLEGVQTPSPGSSEERCPKLAFLCKVACHMFGRDKEIEKVKRNLFGKKDDEE